MASARCPYLVGKEVLMMGWMIKAPPEKKMKKKTGISKVITYKWRNRFFVLFKPKGGLPDEYLLEYFADENCTRKRGCVDLKHCQEIAAFDQTLQEYSTEFVMSLKTLDRNKPRMYFLSCETEDQMNKWVEYLTTVCKMVIRNDDEAEFVDNSDRNLSPTTGSNTTTDYNNSSLSTTLDSSRRTRGDSADSLSSPNEVFSFNSLNACVNQISPDSQPQVPPLKQRSNGLNSRRDLPNPHHRGAGVHGQQYYDTLPTYEPDTGVYHTPPPRSDEYYNVTGGHTDSVYQIPPEMSSGQNAHEYINLTQTGSTDDDVYKIPPSTPPPPPVPRRNMRKSFVRKVDGAPSRIPSSNVYNVPPPLEARSSIYNVPPTRPTQNPYDDPSVRDSVYNVPPPQPQQRAGRPASPVDDHEYLNLWSGSDKGFTEANMPRNINDVPPLVPPLPQRLRNRDPNKSSSTSSSDSSGSSRSNSSSSGQQNPIEEVSVTVVETRPNVTSTSSDHVSYIRAEDLFFGSTSTESNRPASLTEYNELDRVKTKALALLAEDISKINNK